MSESGAKTLSSGPDKGWWDAIKWCPSKSCDVVN